MIVANKFKIKSILIFDQLFGKSNFTSKLKAWLSINQNMIICRHAVVSRIKSRVSASNWLLKRFKKITYYSVANNRPHSSHGRQMLFSKWLSVYASTFWKPTL